MNAQSSTVETDDSEPAVPERRRRLRRILMLAAPVAVLIAYLASFAICCSGSSLVMPIAPYSCIARSMISQAISVA